MESQYPKIKFGSVDTVEDDGHLIEAPFGEEMDSANVFFVHTDDKSAQRNLYKVHMSATADDLEQTLARLLNDPSLLGEVLTDNLVEAPKMMPLARFYTSRDRKFYENKIYNRWD